MLGDDILFVHFERDVNRALPKFWSVKLWQKAILNIMKIGGLINFCKWNFVDAGIIALYALVLLCSIYYNIPIRLFWSFKYRAIIIKVVSITTLTLKVSILSSRLRLFLYLYLKLTKLIFVNTFESSLIVIIHKIQMGNDSIRHF